MNWYAFMNIFSQRNFLRISEISTKTFVRTLIFGLILIFSVEEAIGAHALALGYEPKYKPGFTHFDYVNPTAPKGGSVALGWLGGFDSLNPFLLKGTAPVGLAFLVFETLAIESWDEPFSAYGLLA